MVPEWMARLSFVAACGGRPNQCKLCVGVILDGEAQVNKARQVYLVTLPRPPKSHSKCGRRFVSPAGLTKQDVLQRLLVCCNSPVYPNPKNMLQGRPLPMKRASFFRELHDLSEQREAHARDHLVVLGGRCLMHTPVKCVLFQRPTA